MPPSPTLLCSRQLEAVLHWAVPGYFRTTTFGTIRRRARRPGDQGVRAAGDAGLPEADPLHQRGRPHLRLGSPRPPWASAKGGHYEVRGGVLYLDGLKFAKREQKRSLVKGMYFAPQEPATIESITEKLRKAWCNISRRNVRTILRSLETY